MRITASIAVICASEGMLFAQEGVGWVDLQGGFVTPNGGSDLKSSSALGVGLGGWFTNRWGAEVSFLNSQIEFKATGRKGGETHGMVSGLFNFNSGGTAFFPFARLGMGETRLDGELKSAESNHRANYQGGFGVQGLFGENFIGVLEFRGIRVGTRNPRRNETMGLLGFGYRWGARTWVGKAIPSSSEPPPLQRIMVEVLPKPPEAAPLPAFLPKPR